ncbi:NTP transferase domain-containing protein [Puniceicoccales bacterium CK1056]|uniref:NTP transferase domain-containing protein n=1 Tax=Oceanipulchritudo coccoides TaxID=2706888 RepID=A0A6B2M1W7_9BACT|nr:sugar phosphate nucleotidyltransferase [Oceanipulchritudo coccoides]NDV63001.1 NTP transferase domain-containing protein [Oceanipulchritudo coccoides]
MSNAPTLLVLAAGMGSRYGGLKQLDPMGPNNETVLDYSVHDAMRAGFGKVVFVIRRDIEEAFRESIGKRYEKQVEIGYAFQELDDLPAGFLVPEGRTKPWGTAHALRAARDQVIGPFAVINADDFYGADAYRVLADYFSSNKGSGKLPMCMVGYPLVNTLSEHGSVNRGICESRDDQLLSVREVTGIARKENAIITGEEADGKPVELDPKSLVSMNFWGFTAEIFDPLESAFSAFLETYGEEPKSEFYIPAFIDELIRTGKTSCDLLQTSASWFGVTYPGDKPIVQQRLRELIADDVYPSPLMS